ncbi:JNK1/MAPK8-associated membrane protein-like [Styela clava]
MAEAMNPLCIGRYCGYPPDDELPDTWQLDKCGACPWGYKANETKYCIQCDKPPDIYDWLYLGFMAVLPCMLHWIYILRNQKSLKLMVAQILLSIFECVCACLLSLISSEPKGDLQLVSCGVNQLSDWYTMFYNPQIEYTQTIHCSQEAVYPLMTIVCIYYAYTLILMLLFRPFILSFIAAAKEWSGPLYAALYFHPILVVIHAFIGGLIYYSFPYITLLVSLVAIATYFVWTNVTTLSSSLRHKVKNMLIILWHMSLLTFGIIAISNENYYFVVLAPFPLIFYFLTLQFTDPENIDKERHHT